MHGSAFGAAAHSHFSSYCNYCASCVLLGGGVAEVDELLD
jgi:hypothetical protein